MASDYRKYDYDTEMASFDPLMPKVIKLVGKAGESKYERDFSKESSNLPLCDTTYGADALVSPNYQALANASTTDSCPEPEPEPQVPDVHEGEDTGVTGDFS